MANATVYGFRPVMDEDYKAPRKWPLAITQTIAIGDVVTLDSSGNVIIATATSAFVLGVAATPCTVSALNDPIYIWDSPTQRFEGMASTGALADPYTTRSAGACWDLSATTSAMYMNTAASTYKIFKTVGVSKDPVTGLDSALGTNQMQICMFAPAIHVFGTIA